MYIEKKKTGDVALRSEGIFRKQSALNDGI
jgi:hypothetical protein